MALAATYLADTSAIARGEKPDVAARLRPLISAGQVATCSVVDLEVLYTARSGSEHAAIRRDRALAYPRIDLDQAIFDRAVEVQAALGERGEHRGASLPDLIIAAAAERAGLTVLHYDADFDLIAEVTGQPVEWVVPAGSAD